MNERYDFFPFCQKIRGIFWNRWFPKIEWTMCLLRSPFVCWCVFDQIPSFLIKPKGAGGRILFACCMMLYYCLNAAKPNKKSWSPSIACWGESCIVSTCTGRTKKMWKEMLRKHVKHLELIKDLILNLGQLCNIIGLLQASSHSEIRFSSLCVVLSYLPI